MVRGAAFAPHPQFIIMNIYGVDFMKKRKLGTIHQCTSQSTFSNSFAMIHVALCYCRVDTNECTADNPCIAPATCANSIGSFTCNCPPGLEANGNLGCRTPGKLFAFVHTR